jgi:hypothetical protein
MGSGISRSSKQYDTAAIIMMKNQTDNETIEDFQSEEIMEMKKQKNSKSQIEETAFDPYQFLFYQGSQHVAPKVSPIDPTSLKVPCNISHGRTNHGIVRVE